MFCQMGRILINIEITENLQFSFEISHWSDLSLFSNKRIANSSFWAYEDKVKKN